MHRIIDKYATFLNVIPLSDSQYNTNCGLRFGNDTLSPKTWDVEFGAVEDITR